MAAPVPAEPLSEELKRTRAKEIWEARGRPTGEAGRAVQEAIWYEAAQGIEKELREIAYGIWEERGRPGGAAGEAVKDEIWAEAVIKLHRKMMAKDRHPPGARLRGRVVRLEEARRETRGRAEGHELHRGRSRGPPGRP